MQKLIDPGGYTQSFRTFRLVLYEPVGESWVSEILTEVRAIALCAVGLEDEMHRRIRTVSGRMKRRGVDRRRTRRQPRLLVPDEPSAGLDPEKRLRPRGAISRAAQQGTVLVSTHHTDEVATFCHQVLVLDRDCASPAHPASSPRWQPDGFGSITTNTPTRFRTWAISDGLVRSNGIPLRGYSSSTEHRRR